MNKTASTMTIEERIKRIEDVLGLTEKDSRVELTAIMLDLCDMYGVDKVKARGLAFQYVNEGKSLSQLEERLKTNYSKVSEKPVEKPLGMFFAIGLNL